MACTSWTTARDYAAKWDLHPNYDEYPSTLNEVPLGGASMATGLVPSTGYVPGISVDVNGGYLYWTSYWQGSSSMLGVFKLPLVGGAVPVQMTTGEFPFGIANDSTAVYWIDYLAGTVNKVFK